MQPDSMTYASDFSLLAKILFLIIGSVLLIGVIKLIKHGRGLKLAIGIVSVIAVGVVTTFLACEAPKVVHKAINGVEQVADNLSDTLGDLEKELDKFTKPQIDLGEETKTPAAEEEPDEKSSTELKSEPKLGEPLPAWVTDPSKSEEGVWQTVVATEPCFTMESLARTQKELVRETLAKYWPEHVDEVLPEGFSRWLDNQSDQPGVILNQHTEHRETSVGEAFVSHVLFRVGKPEKEWFSQQWEAWKAEERHANRGMRVAGVGLLSGAVLCGLAVLYGLLRMSEK